MKGLIVFICALLCSAFTALTQTSNIGYFDEKLLGEDLLYFSPLHEFAPQSLLTRCNGESPIGFTAQLPHSVDGKSSFQFLLGHSSGTSGGERKFDVYLNDHFVFTIHTLPKQKGFAQQTWCNSPDVKSSFQILEYDINGDVFGNWNIQVPSKWVKKKAEFKIYGQSMDSRDWLMVFQYQPQFDLYCQATSLIFRNSQRRCLQISANHIDTIPGVFQLSSKWLDTTITFNPGYNLFSIPSHPTQFHGEDTILIMRKNVDFDEPIMLIPIHVSAHRHYEMNLIHHSHNDIGYSHHQTEVEKIQTQNIRSALRWIKRASEEGSEVFWHIESLWAVENFLNIASEIEKKNFFDEIQKGHMVLSANYANILNGLCHPRELPWMVEYAKALEQKIPTKIQNAMITDIPGITYAALNNYVQYDIPYLSLGPNYVEKHADHGDRVGSVIEQTGDTYFYWHPDSTSEKKILVWTSGKGYSYFHNIQNNEKQFQWEKRIAQYVNELTSKNYPLTEVQLRYTKNADNGPVDSTLHEFVRNWNNLYSSPTLKIASINQLFKKIENDHGSEIPHVHGGEISPYWEDGAFSTAKEEIEMRHLVRELIALEDHWANTDRDKSKFIDFYSIHRDVVLFHEHTWGSWCSISDPYSPFTTEQWKYKKSFLLDAQQRIKDIREEVLKYPAVTKNQITSPADGVKITGISVDQTHGGLSQIALSNGDLIEFNNTPFFTPMYRIDLHPTINKTPIIQTPIIIDNELTQTIIVRGEFDASCPLEQMNWTYELNKTTGHLKVHVEVMKSPSLRKESLHFPIHFGGETSQLIYGSARLEYPKDQLKGSNKEFICSDGPIVQRGIKYDWFIESSDLPLIEIGEPIDESQVMGAKVWKRESQNIEKLYLYAFNNYWHTNYKAEQGDEPIIFDVEFWIGDKK